MHLIVLVNVRNLQGGLLHSLQDHLYIKPFLFFRQMERFLFFILSLSLSEVFQAINFRIGVHSATYNVLADISLILFIYCPALGLHVLKDNVLAWVCLVASEDEREEKTVSYSNVLQLYISNIDSRLSLAGLFGIIRIEHASWSSFIRLLLLLGAQIDSPPNWLMHRDILI